MMVMILLVDERQTQRWWRNSWVYGNKTKDNTVLPLYVGRFNIIFV